MNMKQTRRGKRIPTSVKRNRLLKAVSAVALSAVLILQALQFNLSFEAEAATSATSNTSEVIDDLIVSVDKKLEDLGSRVYRVTIEADSHVKDKFSTSSRTMTEDGVYTIEQSGYYLVELWGGKGGNGQNYSNGGTLYAGGEGGKGGYVYGYRYLEAGQSIIFTSGTDGTSARSNAGGENEGGDGVLPLYEVGGGGGYSAVYIFNTAKSISSFTEQERLSNYVLVAGGGGGGGATNGMFSYQAQTGRAHGGAGGSIVSSASGHLTENDNNGVAGTFFAGGNGKSSGSSTQYVGKGGTNIPGQYNATFSLLMLLAEGAISARAAHLPENWAGTYWENNRNAEPGCGGDGVYHGGAGGAGFAGGSGGAQSSELKAENVGGGGGGSSFVADSMNWQGLPADVTKYLEGANGNPSTVGGSCIITYLGGGLDDIDTTHMQSVSLTGKITTYFDILSVTSGNKATGLQNGTISVDDSGVITVTGANIAPDADGNICNILTLTILIRAKEDFAGGYDVPVLGDTFKLTPAGYDPIVSKANHLTDYCNVDLNFKAIGRNYVSNDNTKTYQLEDLYVDKYASIRGNLASAGWQYSFINSIGTYQVYKRTSSGSNSGSALTSAQKPSQTTTYNVQFAVTLKGSSTAATVGSISTTTFKSTSTITIIPEADVAVELNGLQVDASKDLNYSEGIYNLETKINQKSESVFMPDAVQDLEKNQSVWVVPQTGWYFVQVWGGNGGNSGTARTKRTTGVTATEGLGGTGGSGGYNTGYLYLQAGATITYSIGSAGDSSANDIKTHTGSSGEVLKCATNGGQGGMYSFLTGPDGTYLIISGGGGGAGGAACVSRANNALCEDKADGEDGSSSTGMATSYGTMSSFEGGAGTAGSSKGSGVLPSNYVATSGKKGSAGSNYVDSRIQGGGAYDTTNSGRVLSEVAKVNAEKISSSKGSTKDGRIICTFLENEQTNTLANSITGLTTETTIARYFAIEDVELDTVATESNETRTKTTNPDGSFTVRYNAGGRETAHYTYTLTTNADQSTTVSITDLFFYPEMISTPHTESGNSGNLVYFQSGITLRLKLKPADGFLGGNDVPLLQYEETGADDTGFKLIQGSDSVWIPKKNRTDFANVDVVNIIDNTYLEAQNITIFCGDTVDIYGTGSDPSKKILIKDNNPLDDITDEWKKEFVKYSNAVTATPTTTKPTTTTTYTFTRSLLPKASPTVASVVPSAQSVSFSTKGTAYVNYHVFTELTNLTYNGPTEIEGGTALSATLSPEPGYLLPTSIVVKRGTATLTAGSSYTYDSETGTISISAGNITNNITITAAAIIPTYHIYYAYENASGETINTEESQAFQAGTLISASDLAVYNSLVAAVVEKPGYTYSWLWGTDDHQIVTVMPARDIYVTGRYSPNEYTVTVHYLSEDTGDPVTSDAVVPVRFMEDYNILSPNVAGYIAKTTAITGTMDTVGDREFTVYYESNSGKLTIFYFYQNTETAVVFDGGELNPYQQSIAVGTEYSVTSPAVPGYTPDQAVVAGTATGTDVDNGIAVYVYYIPNQYTVHFDANGGTFNGSSADRTVEYQNIYGFDPTQPAGEQYAELPAVFRTGYEFKGWFDADDNEIHEESVVNRASDHTLTAHWEVQTYTLTVYYQYVDGTSVDFGNGTANPSVTRWAYGADYSVPSPYLEGYLPAPEIEGVMGAGSQVRFVTYTKQKYTLSIVYRGPGDEVMSELCSTLGITSNVPTDFTVTDYYGTAYSQVSPVPSGFELDGTRNGGDLSTVSGTIPGADTTITVYYKYIDYHFRVNYVASPASSLFVAPAAVDETHHYGDTVQITVPDVTGFAFSQASVGSTVYTGAGSFPLSKKITGDLECTVTYTIEQYTISVHYDYHSEHAEPSKRGTQAADYVSETLEYGTEYSYTSPTIPDYTPDREVVSGTATGGMIVYVVYSRSNYTLTVNYLYDPNDTSDPNAGTAAAPSVTQTVTAGQAYSIASPAITDYLPSIDPVSGTMPYDNVTVQVIYTKVSAVYDLTVDWGDLTFDYNPGTWDPTTHSYITGTSTLTPRTDSVTGAKLNKITVTSSDQTTDPVVLSYSYAQLTGYEDFTASLWRNEEKFGIEFEYDQGETVSLAPNHSESVWLFLEGESDSVSKGQLYHVGNCTVTITAAP